MKLADQMIAVGETFEYKATSPQELTLEGINRATIAVPADDFRSAVTGSV
jgi:hypothetical protein